MATWTIPDKRTIRLLRLEEFNSLKASHPNAIVTCITGFSRKLVIPGQSDPDNDTWLGYVAWGFLPENDISKLLAPDQQKPVEDEEEI